MPQFDITSFYPQISFFAGIYLILYVFLAKNILPRISQNLKLGKKITEVYNSFTALAGKGSASRGDINFLSHIYNPSHILSHSIYKETLCLIYLQKFSRLLTTPFAAACHWRLRVLEQNAKVRLFKLNTTYLSVLNDIYHP